MLARLRAAPLAFWLVVLAAAWGCALVVGAFVVPMGTTECDPSCGSGSPTLVESEGLGVLAVAGAPLVASLVVLALLHRACVRRSAWPMIAAWAVVVPLLGLCLLAMLSVGVFLLPTALCLLVALLAMPAARPARGACRPTT